MKGGNQLGVVLPEYCAGWGYLWEILPYYFSDTFLMGAKTEKINKFQDSNPQQQ